MLLVPEASVPAVLICSLISEAGTMISALDTAGWISTDLFSYALRKVEWRLEH